VDVLGDASPNRINWQKDVNIERASGYDAPPATFYTTPPSQLFPPPELLFLIAVLFLASHERSVEIFTSFNHVCRTPIPSEATEERFDGAR
jgi:hypothetical protein